MRRFLATLALTAFLAGLAPLPAQAASAAADPCLDYQAKLSSSCEPPPKPGFPPVPVARLNRFAERFAKSPAVAKALSRRDEYLLPGDLYPQGAAR